MKSALHLFFFSVLITCSILSQAQTSADFETESITTNTLVALSFINENEGGLLMKQEFSAIHPMAVHRGL